MAPNSSTGMVCTFVCLEFVIIGLTFCYRPPCKLILRSEVMLAESTVLPMEQDLSRNQGITR